MSAFPISAILFSNRKSNIATECQALLTLQILPPSLQQGKNAPMDAIEFFLIIEISI